MNKTIPFFFLSIFFLLTVLACADSGEEAFVYNSYGRRDPFVPLVGIREKAGVGGVKSILTVGDISIQGILVNPDGSKSIVVNGEIMKEGQRIGRLKVLYIGDNEIKVKLNDVEYKLKLYE